MSDEFTRSEEPIKPDEPNARRLLWRAATWVALAAVTFLVVMHFILPEGYDQDTSIPIGLVEAFAALCSLGFGFYGALNDTKPKDGRLPPAGRIAVFGIVLGGVLSFGIRSCQTVEKAEKLVEAERQDSIQHVKNKFLEDSLRIERKKDIQRLEELDSKLNVAGSALSKVAGATETTSVNVGASLKLQEQLVSDQRRLLQNTERAIAPLNPIRIVTGYEVSFDHPNMRSFEERLLKLKDELEGSRYNGPRDNMIVSETPGTPGEVNIITFRGPGSKTFPRKVDEPDLYGIIEGDLQLLFSRTNDRTVHPSRLDGLEIRIAPNKLLSGTADVDDNMELFIDFAKRRMVVLITAQRHVNAQYIKDNSLQSVPDLIGRYMYCTHREFSEHVKLISVRFDTGSGFSRQTLLRMDYSDVYQNPGFRSLQAYQHLVTPADASLQPPPNQSYK